MNGNTTQSNNETIVMSQDSTVINTSYPGKPLTPDDMEISVPGCEIISKIGSGGMGHVFLARQLSVKRLVAIKFLKVSGMDEEHINAIMNEAATMADLNHPNIVGCYDILRNEHDIFMIMEYVPGQMSVRRLVKRYGKLPQDIVVRILQDIAGGLSYIKSRGYIHHDLKPDNLLVYNDSNTYFESVYDLFSNPDVRVKICDFGIAKHVKGERKEEATETTSIVGTPNYMAPEQISAAGTNDYRSDIYALGCTALFLLTGQQPFQIEDREALFEHKLKNDIPSPKEMGVQVNERLNNLVAKMGKVDPDCRIQDYGEILSELDEIAEELPFNRMQRQRNTGKASAFWKNAFIVMLLLFFFLALFAIRSFLHSQLDRRWHVSLTDSLDNWSGITEDWSVHVGNDKRRTTILSSSKRSRPIRARRFLKPKQTLAFEAKRPDNGTVRFELRSGSDPVMQLTWNRQDGESSLMLYLGDTLLPVQEMDASEDWLKCKVTLELNAISFFIEDELVSKVQVSGIDHLLFVVDMLSTDELMLKNVFVYDN